MEFPQPTSVQANEAAMGLAVPQMPQKHFITSLRQLDVGRVLVLGTIQRLEAKLQRFVKLIVGQGESHRWN